MQQSGLPYIPSPGYPATPGAAPAGYGQQPGFAPQQAVYAAPPAQTYAPPSQQSAPVPPVPFPAYPQAPGQQPNTNTAQNPQQTFSRQLIGVARHLEQALPGIHLLAALGQEARSEVSVSGLEGLLETVKEAAFYHGAALGSIRRFLSGETTSPILIAAATNTRSLIQVVDQIVRQSEYANSAAAREPRPAWANLPQIAAATQSAVKQAGSAAQAALGPQIWDGAEARFDA